MLIIDLLIFIFSIRAFVRQWSIPETSLFSNSSIFLLVIFSFFKFGYDVFKIIYELKKYNDKRNYSIKTIDRILYKENLYLLDDIHPSTVEERNGFVRIDIPLQNDFTFQSKKVNKMLWESTFAIERNPIKKKKIKQKLIREKEDLLPFFNLHFNRSISDNKHFFNQQKLCLSSDISTNENKVFCHKGSYYDTFLTNHVCTKALYKKGDDLIYKDGAKYFPFEVYDNKFRLKEIKYSTINNEIGVSTLGFTSDNYLVLWKQNEHAQSSSNLFVPTGSGSSDWSDFEQSSFNKALINGMERELVEESGLKTDSKVELFETKILGYFRWVKRAGKPEFTGLTKINALYSDLNPDELEVRESRTQHRWQIQSINDLQELIIKLKNVPDYNELLSVPLYMCLTQLEEKMNEDPEEIKLFLEI
ncbi:hypothetical protein [Alkalihalobacillus sp. CinArs1]|uniref:hypothetical protein n=1 Tax=Alkalihalobacillus sp. CinArs1 TaxID=2995314 RepID=UPI0022DDA811|nr:hypothetical protein [Alkalihalobacillus sp. CinArs1]